MGWASEDWLEANKASWSTHARLTHAVERSFPSGCSMQREAEARSRGNDGSIARGRAPTALLANWGCRDPKQRSGRSSGGGARWRRRGLASAGRRGRLLEQRRGQRTQCSSSFDAGEAGRRRERNRAETSRSGGGELLAVDEDGDGKDRPIWTRGGGSQRGSSDPASSRQRRRACS